MPVIVVMGVAGSGKSTVGRALAEALSWAFLEGDDFHPPENIARMRAGKPLTDEDRGPWLERIAEEIRTLVRQRRSAVVSCSALKADYRQRLRTACGAVTFVYLKAERRLLEERLSRRTGHFMPRSLLDSQLATLEEPDDGLTVNAARGVTRLVSDIRHALGVAMH